MNIYEKMLEVTKAVQNVERKGTNTFSNYKYVRAVDVIEAVQGELVKNKICLTISETNFGEVKKDANDKNNYAQIKCTANFINAEKPEERITVDYYAEAADTLDKHIYKAKTNGLKYLLTQQFMIVTDVLADVEQDNKYETHKLPEAVDEVSRKVTSIKEATNIVAGTKATKFQIDKIETMVKASKDPDGLADKIMSHYKINVYQELTKALADEVIAKLTVKK